MRIRPSQMYNVGILCAGLFILYSIYSLLSFDDGSSVPKSVAHKQSRLYLTIDKNRMDTRFKVLSPKRILIWTTVFDNKNWGHLGECGDLTNRCILDTDHANEEYADALIFHGPDLSHYKEVPKKRLAHQRYAFMTMEAPDNTFLSVPGNSPFLEKNFFNWTMTPLFSSDVIFKYGGFWVNAKEAELRGFKVDASMAVDESSLANKIPSVFALISNCDTGSKRELGLKELAKYFNVTLAGHCAETDELRTLCPKGQETCEKEEISKYAFFFAVENTACVDYVSEKYWVRYTFPSIPIIMRRSDYKNLNLPEKSVIAMSDFNSAKEMGEYLTKLAKDKTAYAEYFSWRRGGWTIAPWNSEGFRNGLCKMCERLWEDKPQTKMIEDIREWYVTESQCDHGEFVSKWISGTN